MAWTRWIENETESLEIAIQNLLSSNFQLNKSPSVTYENIEKSLIFKDNQSLEIANQVIQYNIITFSLIHIMGDTSTLIKGLIVVYSLNNKIYYLINRNSDAMRILRLLLNYTNKGAISEHNPKFDDDIFLWCVKRVFESKNIFEINNLQSGIYPVKILMINSILGVKGRTHNLNKLTATGSSLLNLVSTLALVLESNLIEQTKLRLEYTNHKNLEIGLTNKGVVEIDIRSYEGSFKDENETKMAAKVALLVFLEIIPALTNTLIEDQASDRWNYEEKISFLTHIEKEIGLRVKTLKKNFFLEEQVKLNL